MVLGQNRALTTLFRTIAPRIFQAGASGTVWLPCPGREIVEVSDRSERTGGETA